MSTDTKHPAPSGWEEDETQNGHPFFFRRLEAGRMLLVHRDGIRGAWYWQATAGELPRGAAYVSGPDYANPDAAMGAADYYAESSL